MYGTRVEFFAAPGKAAEFEAREAQLQELLTQQAGLERCSLSHSLGYPFKYARLILWESREAADAFRNGSVFSTFLTEHPNQGLYTVARPVEAYESVGTVRGDAAPASKAHTVLIDATIDTRAGNAQAFEASRIELFELRKRYGRGLLTQGLSRFLGGGGRYLAYLVAASREDLQATNDAPEVQRLLQVHPWSHYSTTPPVAEAYERVHARVRQ
jgi:heme-degrading monooxygenase HmoA